MTTIVLTLLAAVVGGVVGAVLHAVIAKDATATKSEVAVWAQKLRETLVADADASKAKVRQLILELEAKL